MYTGSVVSERKATVFNVQKYNIYDGPGIRTMVFFKGCPLRCKWCANPEGLKRITQILFKRDNCVDCGRCVDACPQQIHSFSAGEGRHVVDHEKQCIGCHKCVDVCPSRALEVVGEEKTISELLTIIREDREFYQNSGGGVTLSGGEVLAQPQAAASLLQVCRQEGIHTAIETTGYASREDLLRVARFVDLFLFDLKMIDHVKHSRWTGVLNERILDNLETLLRDGYHVEIRMPIIKGVNDSDEDIRRVVEFLNPYKAYTNLHSVDLLPYHRMGVGKYRQLGMEYPLEGIPQLTDEDLDRISRILSDAGLEVKVIKH